LQKYIILSYSIFYRKPLKIEQIIEQKIPDPFETEKFLISPKIKNLIDNRLYLLKKQQDFNEKNLFFIKHIQDDNPHLIEDFIRINQNVRISLTDFRHDLLETYYQFFSAFSKFAKTILTQTVDLTNELEQVKSPLFLYLFDNYFVILESFLHEVEFDKKNIKSLSIPQETFAKFQEHKMLASEKEEKLCAKIQLITNETFGLFEKINSVIFNDYKITYDQKMLLEKLETRTEPISEVVSERFIPYREYEIQGYPEKTVFNILSKIASLAGTFLFALDHPFISEKIKHKESYIEENKHNIDKIIKLSFFYKPEI
jgi:hypothetical protein